MKTKFYCPAFGASQKQAGKCNNFRLWLPLIMIMVSSLAGCVSVNVHKDTEQPVVVPADQTPAPPPAR